VLRKLNLVYVVFVCLLDLWGGGWEDNDRDRVADQQIRKRVQVSVGLSGLLFRFFVARFLTSAKSIVAMS